MILKEKLKETPTKYGKNNETKLKKELNLMNVLLCLLVVFIHVSSEAVSSLRVDSWQFLSVYIPQKLSSFVVYGFIFISSIKLFIKDTDKIDIAKYYKGRIKKIIIPYIIAVIVYYIDFLRKGFFDFSFSDIIKYIFSGDLVAHFYFIIIISQFYLLFPLWRILLKKVKPIIGIVISMIITFCFTKYLSTFLNSINNNINFIYNDRVFTTYLLYWTLGAYVGKNYEFIKNIVIKNAKWISLSFGIIAILFLGINYNFVRYKAGIQWLEIMQMIYVLSAIGFFYLLCVKMSTKEQLLKQIEPINQNSYLIYLYHVLIIFLITDNLNKYQISNIGVRLMLRFIATYFIIYIFSIIFQKIKMHMKLRA